MSMGNSCAVSQPCSLGYRLLAGAIGGLAGGVVFGLMMWKMGMLTMIASMMGSNSVALGALIHAMISILFGLGIALFIHKVPSCPGRIMLFGIGYGVVLWVIGPLVAMPLMMGKTPFMITDATWMSLGGHLIYAVVAVVVSRLVLSAKNDR